VLLAVALGSMMSGLDSSISNTVLPVIATSLHADVAAAHWVMSIYLLVLSGLLLAFGRLGDLRGYRRTYLAGMALFVAGSAACVFANSVAVLITARCAGDRRGNDRHRTTNYELRTTMWRAPTSERRIPASSRPLRREEPSPKFASAFGRLSRQKLRAGSSPEPWGVSSGCERARNHSRRRTQWLRQDCFRGADPRGWRRSNPGGALRAG